LSLNEFKKLNVGGLTRDELLAKLASHDINFNNYAEILFDDPKFIIGKEINSLSLVKVTCCDLGFSKPPYYKNIVSVASSMGLRECPLSLGAFLRLEYLDQKEGPYLHIASKKTKDDEEYPNGFYLRNNEGKLWLRGYRASHDYEFPLDEEIVFIRGAI